MDLKKKVFVGRLIYVSWDQALLWGEKEKRIGVGERKKELRGSLGRGLSNDYVISNFVNMYVTFCDLLQV